MDDASIQSRLSSIATSWTLIERLHEGGAESHGIYVELFRRYQVAIYRYLLACLKSPDAADDVFQEVALRLWKGDFRHAHPDRGRFRDYLKTTLVRLAWDHRKRRPASVPDAAQLEEVWEPPDFDAPWRDELLARAWTALADLDRQEGRHSATILSIKTQHPDWHSAELAAEAARALDRPITAANFRKQLERARESFAQVLLNEVAQSVGKDSLDDIEAELAELNLLAYCRSAVDGRRAGKPPKAS